MAKKEDKRKEDKDFSKETEELLNEEMEATDDEKDPKEKDKKEPSKKDKLENCRKEIESLKLEVEHWKNEYLKAHADSLNFQKRTNEEAIKFRKYASQSIVSELINPIDMLVQIVNMDVSNPEVNNYKMGFQMITNQIIEILERDGLKPVVAKVGDEFDPSKMQAVETEENLEFEDNKILRVMQAGYLYKDRVLRPAMVVVNKLHKEEKENKENDEKGDEE